MTETSDRIDNAEQITWQRQAAMLLGKLLELAARQHLPAIDWTVASAGATLHGEFRTRTQPQRREYFTTWRDAIAAVTGTDPDTDSEHTFAGEETRLLAKWERIPIDLNPRWRELRPGSRAPSVCVVLTASIWPDDPDEG
jgi:2-methylcitrate dehydratase PrpD